MTTEFYQLADVAKNNGKGGNPTWIIYKNSVYDVTKFLDDHPGGAELILDFAGKDATKEFNKAGHSSDALKDLKRYKIGELAAAPATATPPTTTTTNPPVVTQPKAVEAAQKSSNTRTSDEKEKDENTSCLFCCC